MFIPIIFLFLHQKFIKLFLNLEINRLPVLIPWGIRVWFKNPEKVNKRTSSEPTWFLYQLHIFLTAYCTGRIHIMNIHMNRVTDRDLVGSDDDIKIVTWNKVSTIGKSLSVTQNFFIYYVFSLAILCFIHSKNVVSSQAVIMTIWKDQGCENNSVQITTVVSSCMIWKKNVPKPEKM